MTQSRLWQRCSPGRRQVAPPADTPKLVLRNAPVDEAQLPGLTLEPVGVERGAAQLDLILTLHETPEGFRGHFEYRTRRFSREWIARRVAGLSTVLRAATADPGTRLSALRAGLEEAERSGQRSARQSLQELRKGRFGPRPAKGFEVSPLQNQIEFTASPRNSQATPFSSPLPAPSRSTSMKVPHATESPVSEETTRRNARP